MLTLHGHGSGLRATMGRVARLLMNDSRATLDPETLASWRRYARREDVTLDIVLVSQDPAHALLTPLPEGVRLVGVVAERPLAPGSQIPPDIAVVSDVENATLKIDEGAQIIVDPLGARVLVEPYADEVAKLQQPATRKPRVLLGTAHLPAQTLSGQEIAVWARVGSIFDLDTAIQSGADGLLAEGDGWTDDDLFSLAERVGGGDLALNLGPESVDLTTIVKLAARCRLRWCLAPDDLPVSMAALVDELDAVIDELDQHNERAGHPTLAQVLETLETPLADGFAERVCLTVPDATQHADESVPWERPPLHQAIFPDPGGNFSSLPDAIAAGAVSVIVTPESIGAVKDSIRAIE